jgi:TetR/AcrR family transcriptional regulator, transcriptional repressor for nem operon
MARTREFDMETVLNQAMGVFWKHGYAAASMSDIYAATGLKPGSLYAAFTDKETLFRRCFEAYAAHFRASLPRDRSGLDAIAAWLDTQVGLASEDPERKGCLIVNTIAERDQHSEATKALATGRLQEIRDFFARQLAIAQARGSLAPEIDIAVEADALTGAVVAIMSLGRAGADSQMIAHVAASAIARLTSSNQTIKNNN